MKKQFNKLIRFRLQQRMNFKIFQVIQVLYSIMYSMYFILSYFLNLIYLFIYFVKHFGLRVLSERSCREKQRYNYY